jgi:tetratricopeptide (TPR) repeat protein
MNAQEYFERGKDSFNRGVDSLNEEDFDQAVEDFDQAVEAFAEVNRLDPNLVDVKPNLAIAYFSRGVSRFKKGDTDRAIADITEAISLNPNDATFYATRGAMHQEKKDYDGAIRDFTEAIRLAPTVSDYFSRYCCYFYKCKEYRAAGDVSNFFKYMDLAIDDLHAVLQIDPNHADAQTFLKNLTEEREARSEVYKNLAVIRRLDMNFQDYFERGKTFYESRDYGPAIKNWEAALDLDPGNVQLRQLIEDTKEAARIKALSDHCETKRTDIHRMLYPNYEDWLEDR